MGMKLLMKRVKSEKKFSGCMWKWGDNVRKLQRKDITSAQNQ